MRLRAILAVAAVISAVPVLALLVLAVLGAVAGGTALLAMAVVAAAGFGLALLWARDLGRAAALLRHAGEGRAPAGGHPPAPILPGLASLSQEAARLLRDAVARAALAEERHRAGQAILEGLPDPLLILDSGFRLLRTNRAARRDFGAEIAALLRHPALRAALDRALAEGGPQIAELVLPVPVLREVRATVTVPAPAGGGPERVVILLTDRTRERAVERMRADFVANASHELRTPLAGLIGLIETLRGPAADDPPAQQRFLGIMAEQAARMHRLIEGLLSLSQIELAEHQRPADRVDLAGLAEQIGAEFEPEFRARKARLEIAADPALPPVAGDADQLAQVLQNLLDNALKYGGEGVHIRISTEAARPGEHWPARPGIVLAVADTGPGIAREHLPRLTERFYRVDKGRSRAAGGTGLGLAIVKHILSRHRGQLRIESVEGTGTTFRIWLPAALSTESGDSPVENIVGGGGQPA